MDRWKGYSKGVPPPGAEARLVQRPNSWGRWYVEVRWDGQDEWHQLGTVPEYMAAGLNWVNLLEWTAIVDDLDPE